MSSVLLISEQGDGVPLALRMAQEGSIVKVYIKEPWAKTSLKGLHNPTQVAGLSMLEQYDLVLFDMVGSGSKADQLKEKGKLVLGGGSLNDKLELDRDYGLKVVKRLLPDVRIPESELVKSTKELNAKLRESKYPLVIKPLNNKVHDNT